MNEELRNLYLMIGEAIPKYKKYYGIKDPTHLIIDIKVAKNHVEVELSNKDNNWEKSTIYFNYFDTSTLIDDKFEIFA